MEFINHTPFPALAFEGIDQLDQSFHVVVLRQTMTWNDQGELIFAEVQTPLCEEDQFFGDMNKSSIRQESDLCHYKPRCDVIVNATAYPPKNVRRFPIRLKLKKPDSPMPLPEKPQGLNPYMSPNKKDMEKWLENVQRAKRQTLPGKAFISKTLIVTGERHFIKRSFIGRTFNALLRLGTLSLISKKTWRLTSPAKAAPIPVQQEYAYGGECRINAKDQRANKVKKKHRLTPQQLTVHPDAALPEEQQPIAHQVFTSNPIGRGYVTQWYLDATNTDKIPAPQIETPDAPITLNTFTQHLNQDTKDQAITLVPSLGIRPKGHPARAKLVGAIDEDFINSDKALPNDFNFAIWNAAPVDQQTEFLQGNEMIELTNLCDPRQLNTNLASVDDKGNITLKLTLPGHQPFILVRYHNGAIGELAANLDTLIIEPDQKQIIFVWRALCAKEGIRIIEARMLQKEDVIALKEQPQNKPDPEDLERTYG